MTFNQASLLPLAVLTSWFALFTCGVARDASFNTADKQGILIWESEAVWAVLPCRSPSRWDSVSMLSPAKSTTPKLALGELVPSAQIQVVPGGLAGIQAGLDIWSKGVSGVKLVVELP